MSNRANKKETRQLVQDLLKLHGSHPELDMEEAAGFIVEHRRRRDQGLPTPDARELHLRQIHRIAPLYAFVGVLVGFYVGSVANSPGLGAILGGAAGYAMAFVPALLQTRESTRRRQERADRVIATVEASVKERACWQTLSGIGLEQEVAKLLRGLGCDVRETPTSNDKGIDLACSLSGNRFAVQCKRYQARIGPAPVREFFAAMIDQGFEDGIFVTTSGYTPGALDFVAAKSILLVDIEDLVLASSGLDGRITAWIAHRRSTTSR